MIMNQQRDLSVKAVASTKSDPNSGEIIVSSNGETKVLPAVIFTRKVSDKLLKVVEKVSQKKISQEKKRKFDKLCQIR